MNNKLFLMIVFCLISNTVCPMDDKGPDLSQLKSIELTKENKDKFEGFLKAQLVQQEEIPESASLTLKKLVLEKDGHNQQLGQKYTVHIAATWFTYKSVHNEPGLHILKPSQHGCDIYSHIFDSGLSEAGVNLPK